MAACFIVKAPERSSAGVVYFEDEPWRRAAARLLTKEEARRIAANIASCRSWRPPASLTGLGRK